MDISPISANSAGYLADKYIGTKYDIILSVANALPWLETAVSSAKQAHEDLPILAGYASSVNTVHLEIVTMFGSITAIDEAAKYVTDKQNEIESSIFDMAYNLIRTQAIVAKYNTFV